MAIKAQNTYKHLLKFTSKYENRRALTGFHVTEEGHLEATDSLCMLRLLNHFPVGEEFTFHPKELRKIEGLYPSLDRLIPPSYKTEFELNPNIAVEIVRFLKCFNEQARVELLADETRVSLAKGGVSKIIPATVKGERVEMLVKVSLLSQMCAFIADCVPVEEIVTVGIVNPFRPITFKSDGLFAGLVTPSHI